MFLRIFLLLILSVSINNSVFSDDVVQLNADSYQNFKNKLYYIEDSLHKLTIQDVINGKQNFKVIKSAVPNMPPSLSSYWLYFKIKKNININYYIEFANPHADVLNIYIVDKNNNIIYSEICGREIPISQRVIKKNNFIIPLKVPYNEETRIYIQFRDMGGLDLPVKILSATSLLNEYTLNDLFYGVYYGILLLSILYNFFLFITIKDYSYLFYVISIFFFGVFQLIMNGHFQYIFSSDTNFYDNGTILIAGNMFMLSAFAFVRSFIHSHISMPKLYKAGILLQMACIISIGIALLQSFIPENFLIYNQHLISFIAMLFPFYMIAVGIIATIKGYKPAKFFLIAWSVFLLGILLFVLSANGLLENNFINRNMMVLGSALEATLLSFALGYRYTILKEEKESTQAELNRKLEVSNAKLVKINSDLDNFVYTASHDLRAPISNLEGLVNHLKSFEVKNEEEVQPIIEMMSASIIRLKNTIGDLTEISKVNQNLESDIHVNSLPEVIDEIRNLLKNQVEESETEIIIDTATIGSIRFSKKNFRSILYNLINNAIKYRAHDRKPQIVIRTEIKNNFVLLSVTDNGIGISEQNKTKVFEMFKRAHSHVEGTGIGLYLVKRMIENEGGKIELESNEGRGSSFKVYFKIDYK